VRLCKLVLVLAMIGPVWMSASPVSAAEDDEKQGSDSVDMAMRVHTYLRLGFGGNFKGSKSLTNQALKASASVGVAGRFEYPILKFLTTGGGLSIWSAKADVPASKRKMAFDVGAFIKGRYPFSIKKYRLEAYVLLPVGFSLYTAQVGVDKNGAGYHLGLFPGMMMWVTNKVGVMFELGWSRSGWKYKGAGLEAGLSLDQAAMNLGVTIAL